MLFSSSLTTSSRTKAELVSPCTLTREALLPTSKSRRTGESREEQTREQTKEQRVDQSRQRADKSVDKNKQESRPEQTVTMTLEKEVEGREDIPKLTKRHSSSNDKGFPFLE
jgi:hypothetical protein